MRNSTDTAARQASKLTPPRRAIARAQFIAQTAAEYGVSIGVVASQGGPLSVFVWAPGAPSPKHQQACEQSFKRAVYQNLGAIRYVAKRGRG
jgi:hypothetical protein